MFGLNNMPQVTKNILILNVLMFLLKLYFETIHVDLDTILGAHFIGSPFFQPYQLVSHFFMHANSIHLIFNMFALVSFGGFLERLWGGKRFFLLYVLSAFGAIILYNSLGFFQLIDLRNKLSSMGVNIAELHEAMRGNVPYITTSPYENHLVDVYENISRATMIGASGAVFGIMAAFGILFPNTELQLMFIPIPIKAKYLIGGYFAYELYSSFQAQSDGVAHLAHVGGAIVGAIMVLIWRRRSNNFY